MGLEYKIVAELKENHVGELKVMLTETIYFDKIYIFDKIEYVDFRHPENEENMPNIVISISNKGIYLVEYGGLDFWQDIPEIKHYFEKNDIDYQTLEM